VPRPACSPGLTRMAQQLAHDPLLTEPVNRTANG
jgi:hypothetical protein